MLHQDFPESLLHQDFPEVRIVGIVLIRETILLEWGWRWGYDANHIDVRSARSDPLLLSCLVSRRSFRTQCLLLRRTLFFIRTLDIFLLVELGKESFVGVVGILF